MRLWPKPGIRDPWDDSSPGLSQARPGKCESFQLPPSHIQGHSYLLQVAKLSSNNMNTSTYQLRSMCSVPGPLLTPCMFSLRPPHHSWEVWATPIPMLPRKKGRLSEMKPPSQSPTSWDQQGWDLNPQQSDCKACSSGPDFRTALEDKWAPGQNQTVRKNSLSTVIMHLTYSSHSYLYSHVTSSEGPSLNTLSRNTPLPSRPSPLLALLREFISLYLYVYLCIGCLCRTRM